MDAGGLDTRISGRMAPVDLMPEDDRSQGMAAKGSAKKKKINFENAQ